MFSIFNNERIFRTVACSDIERASCPFEYGLKARSTPDSVTKAKVLIFLKQHSSQPMNRTSPLDAAFRRYRSRAKARSYTLGIATLLAVSATGQVAAVDLTQFSIEELMNVEIFSAAKKSQKLLDTPAAAFVITREDIRRSGATHIPDVLRMVPGVEVAQISASEWAISIRGFNNRFAGNLLVLIDGRSVYTPLFSGVYWGAQDVLLEDVESIEVVRGPGGALWGANAVNGVINIRTRQARDTQGALATVLEGNQEHSAAFRYGGRLGENGHYRVYGKGFRRDALRNGEGERAHDAWDQVQGGFRADWSLSSRDDLTLQGDFYDGQPDQTLTIASLTPPSAPIVEDSVDLHGGNLLLRWKRSLGTDSEWILQSYYDSNERRETDLDQRINTFDIEFQHRFPWGDRQDITWGLGYRSIQDDLDGSFTVSFDPASRRTQLFSAFVQNEIRLLDDVFLTLGSKLEHNDYTGFEIQPTARLLWKVDPQQSVWGAVSRAVRTPSRSDSDIRINVAGIPGTPPTLLSIFGNQDLDSEELVAFELGYRSEPKRNLSLDITAFYNRYDQLTNVEGSARFEPTPLPPHLLLARTLGNFSEADTYGLEVALAWQPLDHWRLNAGYAWINIDAQNSNSTRNVVRAAIQYEGKDPAHQFTLRSQWDLTGNLDVDLALYYVDDLPALNIPSYTRLDLRLGWRPRKDLELSLVGQNLLDDRHLEFTGFDLVGSEIPRSVYGKIVWQW